VQEAANGNASHQSGLGQELEQGFEQGFEKDFQRVLRA
jgi:hypothetical protein